jgi:hypothetical protein
VAVYIVTSWLGLLAGFDESLESAKPLCEALGMLRTTFFFGKNSLLTHEVSVVFQF